MEVIAAQEGGWHTVSTVPRASGRWREHGIPAEVTSFVGRRREVADVKGMLSTSRLVTLTGVGGVGKSRLARRVVSEIWRAFPDGVWLVDLAELENPELLGDTVSDVLGVENASARPAFEALADHLQDMTALLVLDNCEHLRCECAALAATLLRTAQSLRILATSRQRLGIGGEHTLTVPVLSLPGDPEDRIGGSADSDAVRLFADRAREVLPHFKVTDENRPAIERICCDLDGIPLAIELASVRLRALSLQQLVDRIDDRFRLLETGPHEALLRHRTLWALIDWSYNLCTPEERLLWARASVFAGGLDLEAAEAACSGDGIAREDVLDLISGLVDKSILGREESPYGIRYRLLESLRAYGRDRLAESGETAAAQRRHCLFYKQLCADTFHRLFGPAELALLTRLRFEHANLRIALENCFSNPALLPDGLHMAANLHNHWVCGYLGEGRRWLDQGLDSYRTPDEVRARALLLNCYLSVLDGQADAASRMLDEAQAIGERLRQEGVLADVALDRGLVALDQGDAEAAIDLCEDAIRRHETTGDLMGCTRGYVWLTTALTERGRLDHAVTAAEKGIALCDAHHEPLHRAYLMTMLSVALWLRKDTVRADTLAKESLAFHRDLGNPRGIALNLALLAWVAASEGRFERAALLVGTMETFAHGSRRRALGIQLAGYRHLHRYQDRCLAGVRRALGDAAFEAALQRSAATSVEEGLAYALEEPPLTGAAAETAALSGDRSPPLTCRETQVARLVGCGLSNKAIAAELVISQRTAEGHVEHILNKLGFSSRAQIAVWINSREEERAERS